MDCMFVLVLVWSEYCGCIFVLINDGLEFYVFFVCMLIKLIDCFLLFELIVVFEVVVWYLSFIWVVEECFIIQLVMSWQICVLEDELGVLLFICWYWVLILMVDGQCLFVVCIVVLGSLCYVMCDICVLYE